jgi:signal transduction histidine kinase
MFFSRISFKIGVWYSLAFIVSAISLFALTAYLLMTSLQHNDHDLLKEKLQEYSVLYARDGVNGLKFRVSSQEIKRARDFIVRLSDRSGKTLFIHSPDRSDDEDAPTLTHIDTFLQNNKIDNGWIVIPGGGFGDDVEVASKVLPTGETLQVGKDTEDREEFFQSFSNAYFKGLIPIFLLAIAVGGLISHRLLKPIRWLTQTVESIRSGNPKARVPIHQSKDELAKLGTLFNQMLEQNERLLQGMRDTVDNVAHDLRTPIMRLQNAVEGALVGKVEVDRLQEALIDCQENSELLLKLVDGIMDIAEADAGTLSLKKERVNSSELIANAIDLYGFVAEEKNIALVTHQKQSFTFQADRMRLLQAISNLLDNAIKYSPGGTTITVDSRVEDGQGIISISDQGIGIPENEMGRIWERLYRVDSSRSSRGLGLGLSLVKAIVQAHGGRAEVTRNPSGVGTTFFVKFPV